MTGKDTRAAYACHVGGRADQQDCAACFVSGDGLSHFLVVADGMGGHQGGALASRTVIEISRDLWGKRRTAPEDPHAFLETLCRQAHEEIRRRGLELGLNPLSTVAALLATQTRAWWVHVGDSRVYGFRDHREIHRTEDHTVIQNLVRSGMLHEAECQDHPDQHKLLRGLGGESAVRTTHGRMQMTAQTGFVLCTDGFWSVVRADEMPALLDNEEPQTVCTHWAALAAERGGERGDNVTVAVLRPPGAADRFALPALSRFWPLYGALAAALAIVLTRALS